VSICSKFGAKANTISVTGIGARQPLRGVIPEPQRQVQGIRSIEFDLLAQGVGLQADCISFSQITATAHAEQRLATDGLCCFTGAGRESGRATAMLQERHSQEGRMDL
jgi:hypothetical protein